MDHLAGFQNELPYSRRQQWNKALEHILGSTICHSTDSGERLDLKRSSGIADCQGKSGLQHFVAVGWEA